MYCQTSFLANRAIPPCCLIEVGTATDVRYLSVPEQNHESICFERDTFRHLMLTSKKPPACTSHVLITLIISENFLFCTSLEDALFRFPPSRRNTPSGLSCRMLPNLGTNQRDDSCSALWRSSFLMSELASFSLSVSLFVLPVLLYMLLLCFWCFLILPRVELYPMPATISLCCNFFLGDKFPFLLLLLLTPLLRFLATRRTPWAECRHSLLNLIPLPEQVLLIHLECGLVPEMVLPP